MALVTLTARVDESDKKAKFVKALFLNSFYTLGSLHSGVVCSTIKPNIY